MKLLGVGLATSVVCAAMPVQARIRCIDGYQIVNGAQISTPYCRDNYLGEIARRAGFKVTDAEIRNNPARKREICRYVGSNIEAQPACADVDGRSYRSY